MYTKSVTRIKLERNGQCKVKNRELALKKAVHYSPLCFKKNIKFRNNGLWICSSLPTVPTHLRFVDNIVLFGQTATE